ncbi:MAG: S9 family peptidase [Anaerolineae bacterium]|nr:S9 family peptidase [Anaerolineae bacterium]
MSNAQISPYGSWKSPITADMAARAGTRLSDIVLDGEDVYWLEGRPAEGGRNVIVRRAADGTIADVTPEGYDVRTRVHEYGGGAYTVHEGAAFFSHFPDQRLYRQDPGQEPRPITPAGAYRYADGVVDAGRNRLICVREDHTGPHQEAANTLVAVPLDGEGQIEVLASGHDFYSSPRLSPDGAWLAWLAWDHPNMPWDHNRLYVAPVKPDGSLGQPEHVPGHPGLESFFQPEWSPDGTLYFISDRTGWWNLYRLQDRLVRPVWEKEAEFGAAQWAFGLSTYAFDSGARVICTYVENGICHLALLDTQTGRAVEIESNYTSMSYVRARDGKVYFVGGTPADPPAVVQLSLAEREFDLVRVSCEVRVDPGYLSTPRAIDYPTGGGMTAHAFFYAPQNRQFQGPEGEKPPLIVITHGGPTSTTTATLNLLIQFWTSRGFAVVDVNYRGSTGYGRAYRDALRGQWGVADIEDCIKAVEHLAGQGKVDRGRVAIRGGSAGGYTTLRALTSCDVFSAGASYYGISDLELLAKETHKFESRYLDGLIGPYPERRDLYLERSPIYSLERLACPAIFFQGLEDAVVPPNQAETMVEAIRSKGQPVAYVAFEGEQHGFRRAENVKRSLEAELYFYSRVFGFDLPEPVEPVPIENL